MKRRFVTRRRRIVLPFAVGADRKYRIPTRLHGGSQYLRGLLMTTLTYVRTNTSMSTPNRCGMRLRTTCHSWTRRRSVHIAILTRDHDDFASSSNRIERRVNDKVPSSSVGAGGAHAER